MITALRKRVRPDTLRNQVRAGGQSLSRRIYLGTLVVAALGLALQFLGPFFYMEADGLVARERAIVAPDYVGRVTALHVRPGQEVSQGQLIATLGSNDIADRLADLGARRTALISRDAQVKGRLVALATLKPAATERARRARLASAKMGELALRHLATTQRQSETAREAFEAEREEAQIIAEDAALKAEAAQAGEAKARLDELIAALNAAYGGGRLTAPISGRVGARLPHLGQVIPRGEAVADIHHGASFVLAYLPTNRLYGVAQGDDVVVTDGALRRRGRVERLESVTDLMPPEFQSSNRAAERQQVLRIVFPDEPPFALQAKVRVNSNLAPASMVAVFKTLFGALTGAGDLRLARERSNGEAPDDAVLTGSTRPAPASQTPR